MQLTLDNGNVVECYAISNDYVRIQRATYIPQSVKYQIRGRIRLGSDGTWNVAIFCDKMKYDMKKRVEGVILKAWLENLPTEELIEAGQRRIDDKIFEMRKQVSEFQAIEKQLRRIEKLKFDEILYFTVDMTDGTGDRRYLRAFDAVRSGVRLTYSRNCGFCLMYGRTHIESITLESFPFVIRHGGKRLLIALGDSDDC